MIVALLNRTGDLSKTTLAVHPADHWAREGKRVTVIDADPQGSTLGSPKPRARPHFERLFGVIGLARDTLHGKRPSDTVTSTSPSSGAARWSPTCSARSSRTNSPTSMEASHEI